MRTRSRSVALLALSFAAVCLSALIVSSTQVFAQDRPATWPVVVEHAKPTYTEAAMRARIEGEVVLTIEITAEGTVANPRVRKSLDREHGLDEAAIEAAGRWRFKPATKDGQPVAVVAELIISFNLKDARTTD